MFLVFKSSIISNNIPHGFFTRLGGVSSASLYRSLNCSYNTNDSITNIKNNRSKVINYFHSSKNQLFSLKQSHSNKIITVEEKHTPLDIQNLCADGLITNCKNKILSVITADCAPIIFVDETKNVIGILHGGWKGLMLGIIENMLQKFVDEYDCKLKNIKVSIGPHIHKESYIVKEDFITNIEKSKTSICKNLYSKYSENEYLFDIKLYIENILLKNGVELKNIYNVNMDTYTNTKWFFSHRRTTVNQEEDKGLQMSAVSLT